MQFLKGKYLYVIIACCGIAAAVLGIMNNVAGLFLTPIAEELKIGRGSVSFTMTISNLVLALGGLVSPKLVHSKSFKPCHLVCLVVYAFSTALLGACTKVWQLYLLNVIRGFFAGVTGTVLVTILMNHWFYEKTSFLISIAMAFSGIAGALFSPFISSVISSSGWRTGYVVCGVLVLLLELPAFLFPIGYYPEDVGCKPFGQLKKEEKKTQGEAKAFHFPLTALLLLLAYALFAYYLAGYPPHFPGVAENRGYGAAFGSLLLSIAMVANSGGKLLYGYLADRMGARKSVLLFASLMGIGCLLMFFFRGTVVMSLAAGLMGLCYSLSNIGTVSVTREMTGLAGYHKVFPLVNMVGTIATAVGSSVVGFMYDGSGSYQSAIMTAFVLCLGILFVTTVLYAVRKPQET